MKTKRAFHSVIVAVAVGSLRASADDSSSGGPLTQVTFDHLIPTPLPSGQSNFGRLRQTTFNQLIPTSFPAAQLNYARLHRETFDRLIPTSFPATSRKPAGPAGH